jgi:predicted phosphodiesterase
MGWINIAESERDRLLLAYENKILTPQVSQTYNMAFQTLKRRLREHREKRILELSEISVETFPDSPGPDFNESFFIEEDDLVIISDIEIPDHDPAMLQAALLVAKSKNIKTLVIAGDLLATDNMALTRHPKRWALESETTFETAIMLTREILNTFLAWFDRIYIFSGNHDDRISLATGGQLWMKTLLDSVKQDGKEVLFSRYSGMYVQLSRGILYIAHPENFSSTPVSLAQQIYRKINGPYHDPRDLVPRIDKCHIVIGHTHLMNSGMSQDGARECHALGTCRDPMKTQYINEKVNKHNVWVQGFMYIKGGYFYNLARHTTDWLSLLGEYAAQAEVVR